jgi:hypothetical protein
MIDIVGTCLGTLSACSRYVLFLGSHFSRLAKALASKLSSQPTSTKTLMPPSNSSNEDDAGDSDCAPSSAVKLNISPLGRPHILIWNFRTDLGMRHLDIHECTSKKYFGDVTGCLKRVQSRRDSIGSLGKGPGMMALLTSPLGS